MTDLRSISLLPSLLILACTTAPDVKPDDTGSGPGDSEPPADICDDHAGEILCEDGAVVTCDEAGDIASEEPCEAGVCEEGVGCVACAVDLADSYVLEDDEESIGVVLVAHELPLTAPFDQLRLAGRAITVTGAAGPVELVIEGEGLALYDGEGELVSTGLLLAAEDLPATVTLVGGEAGASASLVASHTLEGCEAVEDRIRIRAVDNPGLAGGALEAFPWVSFHQAFEAEHELVAAVDPGRLPDRIGLEADVYVVEHKAPADWAADPSLVDISGTVERLTVATMSLEDSQAVAWAGGLEAGSGLASGYDLVLDFDADGALGPGDLIDGLGSQAGFTVFTDLTAPGPHGVETLQYSGGSWLGQRTYYPSDIASLGQLPLVVVSHGNGHQYTWYDYLGEHLASWGYVVMAHQNNTNPGIETCSTTTLTNTDYLLANTASIGGGVLDGHIDGAAIVWIGHSRGGEGVVRAYDRIVDGSYRPSEFVAEDIVLISSIAPTVFNSVMDTDPHEVAYHLLAGASDGDVTGQPDCTQCQFFRIAAAARGPLQVTYVQGAGHNDFNCCGFADATGPDRIGRTEAQVLAKGYYLALLEWYLGEHGAAAEYFQRLYDDLRPGALGAGTVVASVYRAASASDKLVLDDFQASEALEQSSSGAAVSISATGAAEELLWDANSSFGWSASDPMNGMTWVDERRDEDRGLSFEWAFGEEASVAWTVPAADGDWRDWGVLSFRACQTTRHPNTVSLGAPLDFTVTLVDGAGVESAVSFAPWGGLNQPYQRTGSGQGAGWANEFETVRIPLYAFDAEGTGIDMSDIAAVRFEMGGPFGSATGRIGVDDLEVLP